MTLPTQDVLNQIGLGDAAAFAELRSQFQFPAFKLCSTILKDEEEAEKMIQNVFEKLWEERLNLTAQANFQTYLFATLKSQIFSEMKRYNDPEQRADYLRKMQALH